MTPRLSSLMFSIGATIGATLAFLFVIWTSIDFSEFDRMDYAGAVPATLALTYVWLLVRKRLTGWQPLLALCGLLVSSAFLGVAQEIVISRVRNITNTEHYDFIVGLVIPVLIAVAAWRFLKEKPSTPTAG